MEAPSYPALSSSSAMEPKTPITGVVSPNPTEALTSSRTVMGGASNDRPIVFLDP